MNYLYNNYSQVVVNTGLAVQSKNIPNNSFIVSRNQSHQTKLIRVL